MTRRLALLIAVFTSAPAVAQESRFYTNADLGKTRVAWTRAVTAEELRGLAARQFVLPPQLPDGPTVIFLSRRAEPQPLPPYRPLSEPWSMTTDLGHHGRGFRSPPSARGPGIHLRYP